MRERLGFSLFVSLDSSLSDYVEISEVVQLCSYTKAYIAAVFNSPSSGGTFWAGNSVHISKNPEIPSVLCYYLLLVLWSGFISANLRTHPHPRLVLCIFTVHGFLFCVLMFCLLGEDRLIL